MLTIRAAVANDSDAIWSILEPVIRAGDTYTLPQDMGREEALAHWFSSSYEVFVADDDGHVVGIYHLRPNQKWRRQPCRKLRLYDCRCDLR